MADQLVKNFAATVSSSASSSSLEEDGASSASSWFYVVGILVLFVIVVYLLCHTADNYFSPVLAVICDLLDMPPEVAGVTFLAFGNGAPDVFSSLVALTTRTRDKEGALLVGIGSLLGAVLFTITVIVGSVLHIKSTAVPPRPFCRDALFLMLASLLVLWSAIVKEISVWMSLVYIGMYIVYVVFVFWGPGAGAEGNDKGGGGRSDTDCGENSDADDDHISAQWITLPETSASGTKAHGEARGGDTRHSHEGGEGAENPFCAGAPHRQRERGGQEDGGGKEGGLPGRGFAVVERHFPPPTGRDVGGGGLENDDEEGSLLGHSRDRREMEALAGGDVCSRVSGSTVSMFLEDDDSAANWIAQRRWRSTRFWGRTPGENGVDEQGGEMMSQPLLANGGIRGNSAASPPPPSRYGRQSGSRGVLGSRGPDEDPWNSGSRRFSRRRFEDAWASLQWKQWRMRRRVRRQLSSGDFWTLPWYKQVVLLVELPFVLVRNATIPPVEADSWSQLQAAVGTAFAPLLVVWAFGIAGDGVFGTDIPWAVVALVGGLPVGLAVWLTTHKRRMPSARWYRLALALVAFVSCVAWIYYLADFAVSIIEDIGSATNIPSSILGLTFLAFGNSCGDLVTNLAVSRAGYPSMAIAGSYGGPLFNLLLGVGLPMFWNGVTIYPANSVFALDAATIITAVASVAVLVGTLPAVAMNGFSFPARASVALFACYVLYVGVELWVVLV